MGARGGAGGYFPPPTAELQEFFRQTKAQAQQERLDAEVNRILREANGTFERDYERIRGYLADIAHVLQDRARIEHFLFGGSVAKHTYVDGLSDVDALVVLKEGRSTELAPLDVLERFATMLRTHLIFDTVQSIRIGRMAVTVDYLDGTEIQLLPALKEGTAVSIPAANGTQWREVNPGGFQQALSTANRRLGGSLVPTIKLIKSLTSSLPEPKRLSGYHIEALSMDATGSYHGPARMKDVLLHVLRHASQRVLTPIQDVTGQSHGVDDYLGDADSVARHAVADGLRALERRLSNARSGEEWRKILES